MSNIKELLDYTIYPALYERLDQALPEFNFTLKAGGWISTTDTKVTGETGSKGKVYCYENNISRLIDYSRESISIWDYLQERDNLSNGETLKLLAQLSGEPLPKLNYEQTEGYKKTRLQAQILEDANSFFIDCFSKRGDKYAESKQAKDIRIYFEKRGYTLSDIRLPEQEIDRNNPKMELGYIPSLSITKDYLISKGHAKKDVEEALPLNKEAGYYYKITIPFRDAIGRIKGIVLRTIEKPKESLPKYIYPKGLKKSDTLFNLKAVRGDKDLVIVEGLLDALISEARGVKNVVALGGTSLNKTQIEAALKRGVKKFTLCLDNDKPGAEATLKALDLITKETSLPVYVATFPEGIKDPDQLIKESGVDSFKKAIKEALPYYKYKLNSIFNKYGTIQEESGSLTDKEVDNLLDEVVELSLKLQPVEKDILLKLFTSQDAIKELGITEESLSITVDRLTSTKDKESQAKEFKSLLTEATALQDKGEVDKALDLLNNKVKEVKLRDKATEFSSLVIPIKEDEIRERLSNKPESLSSGYTIEGEALYLPSGAISVFAAPTSHGKTTMLINLALNVAQAYKDKETYLFSYEEDGDSILINALNTYQGKEISRNNRLSLNSYFTTGSTEFIQSHSRAEFISSKDRFFKELIETRRLNIHYSSYNSDTLIEAIRYLHKHANPGAIFIDYIQLLNLPQGKYKTYSRQEEIKEIVIALKDVAIETGLPIVLGAQFNREVVNPLKVLSTNIGEAGDIERIANLIVGFWNTNFAPTGSPGELKEIKDKGYFEAGDNLFLKILKNRGGKVGLQGLLSFKGNTGVIEALSSNTGKAYFK